MRKVEPISELRKICAKEEEMIYHKISIYFTKLFLKADLTANQVTALAYATTLLAGFLWLYPTYLNLVLGALLCQLAAILDCSDGQVARYRMRKLSLPQDPLGFYLEEVRSLLLLSYLHACLTIGFYMAYPNITIFMVYDFPDLIRRLLDGIPILNSVEPISLLLSTGLLASLSPLLFFSIENLRRIPDLRQVLSNRDEKPVFALLHRLRAKYAAYELSIMVCALLDILPLFLMACGLIYTLVLLLTFKNDVRRLKQEYQEVLKANRRDRENLKAGWGMEWR